MPGFLLQVGADVLCPHNGQVSEVSINSRVSLSGRPAVVLTDAFAIGACPADPPCVGGQWMTGATRLRIGGQPAILKDSSGICRSSAGQLNGFAQVLTTQTRVLGT
jgi:hypothetical protein